MNSNTPCPRLFFAINKRQIGTAGHAPPKALERVGQMTCAGLPTLRIGDSAIFLHDYIMRGISTFSLSKYKLRLGRQSLTHAKKGG